MSKLLSPFLAALVLISSTGSLAIASGEANLGGPGAPSPVYVDSTEILYAESFPVQVFLLVQGSLPTPCHEPVWEVEDMGSTIDVHLWSLADPDQLCVQVLEPFEISIPLGAYTAGDVPVSLNGEAVGSIQIGEPQPLVGGGEITGAGWSFGMCGGYCVADLVINGDRVVLTGNGNLSNEPLYEHSGTLTPLGLEQLREAERDLAGVPLERTYGCPDCADGGAAYLALSSPKTDSRHDMEFGNPPAELANAYGLVMSLIGALESCTSSALVAVDEACVPPSSSS